MGLDALLSKLKGDTPDTPRNLAGGAAKPLLYKACTPDTPDTPPIGSSASWEAGDAVTEQPAALMDSGEEKAIRTWLAHIGETDAEITAEVMDKCQRDAEALAYFLLRSGEVPKPDSWPPVIRCSGCIHFERIDHPHLGHCAKGEPEAIAGLWGTDRRYCEQYRKGGD